jgi:hypothetical protein
VNGKHRLVYYCKNQFVGFVCLFIAICSIGGAFSGEHPLIMRVVFCAIGFLIFIFGVIAVTSIQSVYLDYENRKLIKVSRAFFFINDKQTSWSVSVEDIQCLWIYESSGWQSPVYDIVLEDRSGKIYAIDDIQLKGKVDKIVNILEAAGIKKVSRPIGRKGKHE